MTAAADPDGYAPPGVVRPVAVRPVAVRPVAVRVVRPEWAADAVAPMVDASGGHDQRRRAELPETAYDDAPPAFYVYRMRDDAGDHLGVVADVRLDAFAGGGVRGHESVEADRVDALVRYYADLPARSEPVALLHDHPAAVRARVAEACAGEPLVRFTAPDGVEHAVWRVTGDGDALAAGLGRGVHYIADGHHRVAARLRAWDRAGRPAGAGVLCVVLPRDGLRLASFHRRVAGPVDAGALLAAATDRFTVRPVPDPGHARGLALFLAGAWHDLEPHDPRPAGAAGLDVSVLHSDLLGPVLGIPAPPHPRLDVVPDHVPLADLVDRCAADGGALVALRPPSVETITRVADLGEVLPPKSTYFSPKPLAGIFLT